MGTDPVTATLATAISLTGCSAVVALAARGRPRPVQALTWVAYTSTVAVSWAIWMLLGDLVLPDALEYQRRAVALVSSWTSGTDAPVVSPGKEGFVYTLAWLYRLSAPTPLVGLTLNAMLGALTVIVGADTARRIVPAAQTWTAAILALAPPMVWWSAQMLREPAVWLLIAVAVNAGVRILRSGISSRPVGTLVCSLLLLGTVRTPIALAVGGALTAAISLRSRRHRVITAIGMTVLISATMVAASQYEGVSQIVESDATQIASRRNALIREADSAFGRTEEVSGLAGLASVAGRSAAPVTVGPLPWHVSPIAWPDVFTWWAAVAFAAIGYRHVDGQRRRMLAALVWPAAAILLALAMTSGNYGTMIRLRAQALVVVAPLAAIGIARLRGHDWSTNSSLTTR